MLVAIFNGLGILNLSPFTAIVVGLVFIVRMALRGRR
jgi:hypothetical protein